MLPVNGRPGRGVHAAYGCAVGSVDRVLPKRGEGETKHKACPGLRSRTAPKLCRLTGAVRGWQFIPITAGSRRSSWIRAKAGGGDRRMETTVSACGEDRPSEFKMSFPVCCQLLETSSEP
jgi:hypothetical protein